MTDFAKAFKAIKEGKRARNSVFVYGVYWVFKKDTLYRHTIAESEDVVSYPLKPFYHSENIND